MPRLFKAVNIAMFRAPDYRRGGNCLAGRLIEIACRSPMRCRTGHSIHRGATQSE